MTPTNVQQLLDDAQAAALSLSRAICAASAPWDQRLAWLHTLRSVIETLAQIESSIESGVVREMPDDRVVIGHLVAERVQQLRQGQWDDAELSRRIADAVMHDRVTGELGDPATAARVVAAFLLTCRPQWRVTALRALEIDYRDLSMRIAGRRRIKLYGPT